MKKILFLLVCLFIPISCFALEYPNVSSKYVETYDITDGKVLYEKNSNEVVSIASLTKLATIMTAIENIENLDEEVTITYSILNTVDPSASVAGLRAGDILTYRDLLYGLMLPSGAEAAQALTRNIAGSTEKFIKLMNDKAEELKLENT